MGQLRAEAPVSIFIKKNPNQPHKENTLPKLC